MYIVSGEKSYSRIPQHNSEEAQNNFSFEGKTRIRSRSYKIKNSLLSVIGQPIAWCSIQTATIAKRLFLWLLAYGCKRRHVFTKGWFAKVCLLSVVYSPSDWRIWTFRAAVFLGFHKSFCPNKIYWKTFKWFLEFQTSVWWERILCQGFHALGHEQDFSSCA